MKAVAIVDTSVFCNILNIPRKNSDRAVIMQRLKHFLNQETNLLLPMAAIYETGNHIAQIQDGGNRRRFAELFSQQVRKAIQGEAPWQVMQLPDVEEVGEWLNDFPNSAMRGAGIGDLSMIKEWERMIRKAPSYKIFIWSIDSDLQGYEYTPSVL